LFFIFIPSWASCVVVIIIIIIIVFFLSFKLSIIIIIIIVFFLYFNLSRLLMCFFFIILSFKCFYFLLLFSEFFLFYFHVFFFLKLNKVWCKHDWVLNFSFFSFHNLVFLNFISCKLDVQYYRNLINFKFPCVNIKLCTRVQEKWARSQCSLCCSLKQLNYYPKFFLMSPKGDESLFPNHIMFEWPFPCLVHLQFHYMICVSIHT
jgi:hypothetical protein